MAGTRMTHARMRKTTLMKPAGIHCHGTECRMPRTAMPHTSNRTSNMSSTVTSNVTSTCRPAPDMTAAT